MSAKSLAEQIAARRAKLAALKEAGWNYPNDFGKTNNAAWLHARYDQADPKALEENPVSVRVAGRIVAHRVIGKTSFVKLRDGTGDIQLFLNVGVLGAEAYAETKRWDLGDIVGAEGELFFTRTGELSVRARSVRMLVKCLRPLPEKWHGITDKELRYRKRYLDLIAHPEVREVFTKRARVIQALREGLLRRGFLEVETPILQAQPGGAAARPFITHHNALDHDFYLRIAPELFLKRLLVGGFERVFELGRNFRNEGMDTLHNPEFTMLEFYAAWGRMEDGIAMTEALVREAAEAAGALTVQWRGMKLDFTKPFRRMRMDEAVVARFPELEGHVKNKALLATVCMREIPDLKPLPTWGAGHYLAALFEHFVEPELSAPTFITHFPVDVSPLARRDAEDPFFTERFELFIGGHEIANGFSELNDPDDQRERFLAQQRAREAGDVEAAPADEDFVEALEYGMPPAVGVGIGVDRLVMLLTGQYSIRDVLLFPHLRPKE